jgi:prevent-host-death family protein
VIKVQSDEARRRLRWLLSEVERGGVVEISRYQDPAAVMVPPGWYRRAVEAVGEPPSDC